jgi:hypothetical protein
MEQNYKMEYRITGRFRKNEKRHVVDGSWRWTKADAEKRLQELMQESNFEMENKRRKADYDLLDLRLQSRKISKWAEV